MYKQIKQLLIMIPDNDTDINKISVVAEHRSKSINDSKIRSVGYDFKKMYGSSKMKTEVVDNDPIKCCVISGIKFVSNKEVFLITDPRGFTVNVESRYIYQLMCNTTIKNSIIEDEIIWLKDKTYLVPVNPNSNKIKPICNDGVSLNSLDLGDVVTTEVNNSIRTYIYLGKGIKTYTINYEGTFPKQHKKIPYTDTGKVDWRSNKTYNLNISKDIVDNERHVLLHKEKNRFVFISSNSYKYKIIDNISIDEVNSYISFIEKDCNDRYITDIVSKKNKSIEENIILDIKSKNYNILSINSILIKTNFESTNLKHTFKKINKMLK